MSPFSPLRPPPPFAAPGHGRVNSAGLGARELKALLDQIDRAETTRKRSRLYARLPYRHASIALALTHPGSSATVSITVASRNLSRGGMGVLHGGYVHPRSRCVAALPRSSGGVVHVPGIVTHCRHVRGMVHEVGVAFDEPISVREFLTPEMFAEAYSFERVDPAGLRGSVLHVEHSSLGQKLVAAYVKDTLVRLRVAESVAQALAVAGQGVDVVLADFQLPDGNAPGLLASLRARGIATPVILLTADTSDATRREVGDARVDGFLIKPITRERLLRALAEFLLAGPAPEAALPPAPPASAPGPAGPGPEAIYSSLAPGDPAASLVEDFVREAPSQAVAIRAAVAAADSEQCRRICLELGGVAPSCGFEGLARAAGRAVEALSRTGGAGDSGAELEMVAAMCDRVRLRAAAA